MGPALDTIRLMGSEWVTFAVNAVVGAVIGVGTKDMRETVGGLNFFAALIRLFGFGMFGGYK